MAKRDELEHEDKEVPTHATESAVKDKLGVVTKELPAKKTDPLAGNVWPYNHETK